MLIHEVKVSRNWEKRIAQVQSPFYSAPQFLKFLEIWFKKSGSRNLVQEIWFKKSGSANSDFFWFKKSGCPEKQVGLYYKSTLQNHFSRTTFLHFSRKVAVD